MATGLEIESICRKYQADQLELCRIRQDAAYIAAVDAAFKLWKKEFDDALEARRVCEDKYGCPGNGSNPQVIIDCRGCADAFSTAKYAAERKRDGSIRTAEQVRNCALDYPDICSKCSCCEEGQQAYAACKKAKGIPPVTPVVNPPIPASPGQGDPLKQALDEQYEKRKKIFPNQPDLTPM